ncbi:tetratricopeptide repeat protein [Rubellimicrobium rubrum]|uniref:Tetratricopeptide repeat protein n=1 Tax=Rubellimicrobium rubrum TaxID=2585369 RepID=A0A5C4MR46_9RHOB|nr:tetratricopeptide repeat protein [Rubellimicrobium rubrum]TNC47404.1 tetratricopeptide repeat protein [Rubellimicrobium rubrum]
MPFLDVQLTSWSLDVDSPVLRRLPRPAALRHADFEDKFDPLTVFYDCFWLADGRRIALLGPPLLNLDADLDLRIISVPHETVCEARRIPGFHVDTIYVDVPDGTTALRVCSRVAEVHLVPQPNLCQLFRDRRVITTLSKDNEPLWIRDWATYHQEAHGCDGVLIYDNGSTGYSVREIHEALRSLNDVKVVVLGWPFRYGLFDGRVPVSYDIWDWHPCQNGMLEHARRRFLDTARSVLNLDVDELVLTENGDSVFSLVEESGTGHIRLDGLWVENFPVREPSASASPPRHKDFCHVRAGRRNGCEEKWAVVPGRTPEAAQWAVHDILGMSASEHHRRAQLRHFKALNTDWAAVSRAGDRTKRTASSPSDPNAFELDATLRDRLATVFPADADQSGIAPDPRAHRSAISWRLRAGTLWSCGQVAEAIEAVRKAISLDEDAPALRLFLGQMLEASDQPEEAERQRAIARKLREADGAYHCQIARLHLEERDFDRAEAELLASLALEPDLPAAHLHLARLLDRSGRRAEALIVLERCVERAPGHALGRAALASRLIEDGRYPDAQGHAARAVELNPANPHYYAVHGEALRLMGQLDEAERVIETGIALDRWAARRHDYGREVIDRGPEPIDRWAQVSVPNLRHQLAHVFIEKGQLDRAERAALDATALGPPSVNDHILLARIRLRQGAKTAGDDMEEALRLARQEFDRPSHNESTRLFIREREEYSALVLLDLLLENRLLAEAETVLTEAERRLRGSPALAERRALLLGQSGDGPGATAVLEEAIGTQPGHAGLHAALSRSLKRTDIGRAIEAAKRAWELDPTRGEHPIGLAELLAFDDRLGEAEEVLSRANAVMPDHPALKMAWARVLERTGDRAGAISAVREAIALGSRDAWILSHLGGLLVDIGATDEAFEALTHADRTEPDNALTLYRLGRLHEVRRDLSAAVQFYRRAAARAGDQGWMWSHLGAILLELGEIDEGTGALERALELDPNDWLGHCRYGTLMQSRGDMEASVRAIRTAVKLKPDQAWVWSHLGQLLMEQGLWQEAERALGEALSLDPQDPTTQERLARLGEVRG